MYILLIYKFIIVRARQTLSIGFNRMKRARRCGSVLGRLGLLRHPRFGVVGLESFSVCQCSSPTQFAEAAFEKRHLPESATFLELARVGNRSDLAMTADGSPPGFTFLLQFRGGVMESGAGFEGVGQLQVVALGAMLEDPLLILANCQILETRLQILMIRIHLAFPELISITQLFFFLSFV